MNAKYVDLYVQLVIFSCFFLRNFIKIFSFFVAFFPSVFFCFMKLFDDNNGGIAFFPSFLQFVLLSFAILLPMSCVDTATDSYFLLRRVQSLTAKTIIVDAGGKGDFKTVQSAINSVRVGNRQWITVHIRAGIYHEKVLVPADKPFIFLEGEGRYRTFITWGDTAAELGTAGSATFTSYAPHFVARGITFKNTFVPSNSEGLSQAVAALVAGDMSAFYGCGFVSIQDTLFDAVGRHLFQSCYIEGAIDFIFGSGRSLYKDCKIFAKVDPNQVPWGWITAQARDKTQYSYSSGFVFHRCQISGIGKVYLGRAWRPYSRVIFSDTFMSDVVVPEGWDTWGKPTRYLAYTEYNCSGPGSVTSKRVKWLQGLTLLRVVYYTSLSFIDLNDWCRPQHNSFARQIPERPIRTDGL